ncbi:MAG TPA: hypothetical protein VGZ00_13065 [Candidatus Baltobacteraceae bacterium]|nr:hypothetical protein [Candidatus Baltobacteraceae bacterium]
MADPVFEPVLGSQLYVLTSTSDDRGWSGYLLLPGQNPPQGPLSIGQSLKDFSGHYLFADSAPQLGTSGEVQAFVDKISSFVLQNYSANATICLWIKNAQDVTFGPYPAGSCSFSYGFGLAGASLQSDFNHVIGRELTLVIGQTTAFDIPGTAIILRGLDSLQTQLLRLVTSPNDGLGPSIAPQRAVIPFTGSYRGCILTSGLINTPMTLPFFKSGLRYTHGSSAGDVAQTFPVIRTQSAAVIAYSASLDPNDTFNEGPLVDLAAGKLRTLFAIDATKTPSLPSWLSAASGHSLSITAQGGVDANGGPTDGAGALVFERIGAASANPNVYLGFAGRFGMSVDGLSNAPLKDELLCGLFGTETIAFRPYSKTEAFDALCFTPQQRAYAPVFPYKNATLDDISANKPSFPLDDTYRTAWVSVRPTDAASVTYRAQPEGSSLFALPKTSLAGSDNLSPVTVLDYHPTPATLPTDAAFVVPFAAYAGVATATSQFPAGELPSFESRIIGAARKELIGKHTVASLRTAKAFLQAGAIAEARRLATTPQGLLAELAGEGDPHYLKVTLAQSPPGPSTTGEMAFFNLDAELQNALQTNQLFLVAVDRTHFGKPPGVTAANAPAFADAVTIEGWTMRAEIGEGVTATDYRNVLIMKFAEGSLLDRVGNPQDWTAASDFSRSSPNIPPELALTGLSTWLQDYITQAVNLAKAGNSLYQNFATIAQDPHWKGILVLRATLDVDSLPEQLKGLAAGIDLTQFLAHHFGVYASRVIVDGTTLKLAGLSSLFGLVDYQLPAFVANVANNRADFPVVVPIDGPYGFTVLQLQSLFNNSRVIDFRSRVQLTINQLFDSPVISNSSAVGTLPINAIVLKGAYERQGTADTYVYRTDALTLFNLNSNVLQAVAINRAQFNAQAAPVDANKTLDSRFLLWGALDFTVFTEKDGSASDLFSFGSPPGTPANKQGTGLQFSGLAVHLASPVATPNTVTYTFDAGNLTLDPSASTPRPKSLFSTFALQLRNVIQAPGEKRPADYGFLTSTIPAVDLQKLSGPWYGIVYKVTMGTPGALVSDAGFTSTLVTAWSPQSVRTDRKPAGFIGLQLPGAAPGAKLLSLQGVLKVTVGSIDLLHVPIKGHAEKAYNLRLNNIGLTFLGIAKLPPGATINFFLFGDPEGIGSLGWYAAYIQDQSAKTTLVRIDGGS